MTRAPGPELPEQPEPSAESSRRRGGAGVVAALIVIGLLAGAVTLVRGSLVRPDGAMADGMSGMTMDRTTAPIALETLNAKVAGLYRHAADHEQVYRDVPCYCGCDRFADHRHLYDCFVRPDGAGFEAHGAGCAICQAEAAEVRRLLDRGHSPAEIRDLIIEQFGPATNPAT